MDFWLFYLYWLKYKYNKGFFAIKRYCNFKYKKRLKSDFEQKKVPFLCFWKSLPVTFWLIAFSGKKTGKRDFEHNFFSFLTRHINGFYGPTIWHFNIDWFNMNKPDCWTRDSYKLNRYVSMGRKRFKHSHLFYAYENLFLVI